MIISYQQLSADTLQNLLEEFVSRDGTDYGEIEAGLEFRVEQVRAKLRSGEATILFSQNTGLCNIVPTHMLDE